MLRIRDRLTRAGFEPRLAAPAAGLASACHQGTPRAIPLGGWPCPVFGIGPPGRDSNCVWLRQSPVSLPTAPRAVSAIPFGGWPCSVFGIGPPGRDSNCVWLRQSPVSLRRAIKARLGRSHSEVRILSTRRSEAPEKGARLGPVFWCFGRRERIRTSDPYHPKVVRYQAAPRAVNC